MNMTDLGGWRGDSTAYVSNINAHPFFNRSNSGSTFLERFFKNEKEASQV